MSQPYTTSQNPKPPSTAEANLSLCRTLPRRMPSMSETATFTPGVGDLSTSATIALSERAAGIGDLLGAWGAGPRECSAAPPWENPPARTAHVMRPATALLSLHAAVALFGI